MIFLQSMLIFSGSSNQPLASKIAEACGGKPGEVLIETFANGERRVRILSDVRRKFVVLVQSFSHPVDTHIMEFLLMADALERAGSKKVIAVIPWLGYSLQDKVFTEGEPIAAKVVADLISHAFTSRTMLLDLHNSSIPGFFAIPTQHLRARGLFAQYARDHFDIHNVVAISPDFGGLKPARVFADELGVPLANIDKHRDLDTGEIKNMGIGGNSVEGKICLVYDDVINTGGTVVEGAKFLKQHGAKEVHFFVSHGLFAGEGMSKMADSAIDSVVITDSIFHRDLPEKVKVVSVAKLFADEIKE